MSMAIGLSVHVLARHFLVGLADDFENLMEVELVFMHLKGRSQVE
jgi:hypothetical protein